MVLGNYYNLIEFMFLTIRRSLSFVIFCIIIESNEYYVLIGQGEAVEDDPGKDGSSQGARFYPKQVKPLISIFYSHICC